MRLPSYEDLSKEQDGVLNLPLQGKHLVIGPPGTGKTVLALYRGKMLNRAKTNFKLLMFNHALRKYTAKAVEHAELDASVEVYHPFFYGFIVHNYRAQLRTEGFVDKKGMPYVPEVKKYLPDFDVLLTRIVTDAPGTLVKFPHLIVDEGQDLPGGFYLLFQRLAGDTTVFADENQIITESGSTIDTIRNYGGFRQVHKITKNYRNSIEIARLSAGFYTGLKSGIPDLPDRRGEMPSLLRTETLRALLDRVVILERNSPDKSIGILVKTNKCLEDIFNELSQIGTRNPIQVHRDDGVDFDSPGIKLVTYASAKGLEFDSVFLPELQDVWFNQNNPDEIRRMFFVLTSRARERLVLAYRGKTLPLLSVFPPDWKDLLVQKEEEEDAGISSKASSPSTSQKSNPQPTTTQPTGRDTHKQEGDLHPKPHKGACTALELMEALEGGATVGKAGPIVSSAKAEARFHTELYQLVDYIVLVASQNKGKVIGVLTQQSGLYKRLVNRLTGKTSPVYLHESSTGPLSSDSLAPGVHLTLDPTIAGTPFDILILPRVESLAIDSPHCRKQLSGLLMAAREHVILSFENRPIPLLPGVGADTLKRLQELI